MPDDPILREILQRIAALAPGLLNWNTLIRSGIAGHIHANFDRVEQLHNYQVDVTNSNKRTARLVRPGAILLANLDIDEDPGVPRARFAHNAVDSKDHVITHPDDEWDVAEFFIAEPQIVQGNATRVNIRIDPADQNRVRIWKVNPAAANLRDAPNVVEVIGPGVAAHHEVRNMAAGAIAAGWRQRYVVEALTLPGDPQIPAPAGNPPNAPGAFRTPQADTTGGSEASPVINATNTANPIYATRAPGDIWVEIVHDVGGVVGAAPGGFAPLLDVGLFTIAPWIMTWNTLNCERIYICLYAHRRPPAPSFNNALEELHPMVYELQEACHTALPGTLAPNADTSVAHVHNNPGQIRARNQIPFYIIDPADSRGDTWTQDEFEIGYCWAPQNWMHVVLHIPRNGDLQDFVSDHMAHTRLGIFHNISVDVTANATPTQGQDAGGNLEVSPPVPTATPAISRDMAGPSVKAHRAAPFGKILVGDYQDAVNGIDGRICNQFRDFLIAQRVQPVLPFNTSWLTVGHVDEFSSFVRATDSRGFKLLIAKVRLMTIILREVLREFPAATIHAGKYIKNGGWEYGEKFVRDWLGVGAASALRSYSEDVERKVLSKIRKRFKQGLDLQEEHILSIPTYWKRPTNPNLALGLPANRTIAENVGMVNMLVVNDHLMVPRPYGPRLPRARAERAVTQSLERWFGASSAPSVSMPAPGTFSFWARPNESVEAIAMYFCNLDAPRNEVNERDNVINALENASGGNMHGAIIRGAINTLPVGLRTRIANFAQTIRLANPGLPVIDASFPEWRRINIPDKGTVDVLEVYMKSILEDIGNTVHFIEDFESFHEYSGEVHCATNAKRSPPELESGFTTRWWDRGVYDPSYDTTYNPAG